MFCVKIVNRFMRWHARAKVTQCMCVSARLSSFLSYCEKRVAPCYEIVENNILQLTVV